MCFNNLSKQKRPAFYVRPTCQRVVPRGPVFVFCFFFVPIFRGGCGAGTTGDTVPLYHVSFSWSAREFVFLDNRHRLALRRKGSCHPRWPFLLSSSWTCRHTLGLRREATAVFVGVRGQQAQAAKAKASGGCNAVFLDIGENVKRLRFSECFLEKSPGRGRVEGVARTAGCPHPEIVYTRQQGGPHLLPPRSPNHARAHLIEVMVFATIVFFFFFFLGGAVLSVLRPPRTGLR